MARISEGYTVAKDPGRKTYVVRFRWNKRQLERSTGASDLSEAAEAAARIYADYIQRNPRVSGSGAGAPARGRGDAPPLDELISTWLAGDSTLDPDTVSVWITYGRHWCRHWGTIADVTDATCEDYRNARLRVVTGSTVRKELGALRRFLRWAKARDYLPREVAVPGVPSSATGTRYSQRRRTSAPELSPAEIAAFLAALPEYSTSKRVAPFPIRARFIVQYETGLRPSTISSLSVPQHYTKGSPTLTLTDDVDKARWGRTLPLTAEARAALDAVCPADGLIFGDHDYREHVAAAAKAVFPKAVAAKFTGAHLRSARTTHLLERPGANLTGVQYLVGHRRASTTDSYARPSFRAAEEVIRGTVTQGTEGRTAGRERKRAKKP